MNYDPIVIVAARRTPLGAFQGTLSPVSATDLSATANRAAVADSGDDGAAAGEAARPPARAISFIGHSAQLSIV